MDGIKRIHNSNKILVIVLAFFLPYLVKIGNAVNLSISNITLSTSKKSGGSGGIDNYKMVNFDLSWEHSWKNDTNWDASWIFVKFRVNDGNWEHATINDTSGSATDDGHREPSGVIIKSSPDNKGAFIVRNDVSKTLSSVNFKGIGLRWNFTSDGVHEESQPEIRVFGIEMVYIPEGPFAVGNEGSEFDKFNLTTIHTADAKVKPKTTNGLLGSPTGGYPLGEPVPHSSEWPNGYNAFYCMKYELSQGQYIHFLNTLTPEQAANRFSNRKSARHGIVEKDDGYYAVTPNRACNFLSWADGASYADWAALRPLTELEYEKACRGPVDPVPDEYAWGTSSIFGSLYRLTDEATDNEKIANLNSSSGGNAAYNKTNGYKGPYTNGIFVSSSQTRDREKLGASYFGVLAMSGNLWERTITISHPVGRDYTGQHGNGQLMPETANANVKGWPGPNAEGVGFRGGGWRSGSTVLRISDRVGAKDTRSGRSGALGFRGVRSVP